MARKSKRLVPNAELPVQDKIYNVAIYLRLSIEDRLYKDGSDSLKNQEELIRDYLRDKSDMKVYDVYCDNGETGTDFDREHFQRMMFDIYNGKVNCIIVKDLSRFGREYIEAGDYLDKIFPLIGVRFIAINDNYDNKSSIYDVTVPIKNIINTLYARDLSRKSSAALRIKQANGEFIGSYAAYGYLKSPEDKHKIIVDTEVAHVVKMIFEWKAEGLGNTVICRKLYEMNIKPPSRYFYDKGIIKDKRCKDKEFWPPQTIKAMLENPVYIGNLTQGRKKSYFFEGGKGEVKTGREHWIVVPDTHEPIVSKELFEKVQVILSERRTAYERNYGKYKKLCKDNNIFKGKIVCGDCGSMLNRTKYMKPHYKKPRYVYKCVHQTAFPSLCSFHSIPEETVKNIVLQSVRMQISVLSNLEQALEKISKNPVVRKKRIAITQKISDILSSIAYAKTSRIRAATDFSRNLLDEESYKAVIDEFDSTLNYENARLEIINKQKNKLEKLLSSSKWISDLKKYKKSKHLSQEIVDAFVEEIKIYPDKRIEIKWIYADKCNELADFIKNADHIIAHISEEFVSTSGGEHLAG